MRPVIGITMGDAAGVGPELILKTLSDKEVYNECMRMSLFLKNH